MPQNPINPKFSFRFTTDEIRASYKSLDEAFEHGAYLLVAEFAEPGSELEGCALVLAGALGRGLAVLTAQAALSSRGLVCKAFAEWSLDRREAARASLLSVPSGAPYADHAGSLLGLIEKQQISVFVTAAFLPVPSISNVPESARAPVQCYGSFLVKHVGTQATFSAYDYEPHQPFDEFIDGLPPDERPDLIFTLTPLWPPPKNLDKVKIPKVVWCHDTDILIYRAIDNLKLYDALVVNTSQEHFELTRATDQFCMSNLVSDPLSTEFPPARPASKKDIDIIFTGSVFDSFHAEKARFIFALAELGNEYQVRVIQGHLPQSQYYDLLSRSKFLPIVNRYAGCPSPRWRDALANSAYVLYPRGTGYGRMFAGCHAFDIPSLANDVRKHLQQFDLHDAAYDPSKIASAIESEMSLFRQGRDILVERQLKYAAFAALVLRPQRRPRDRLHSRRLVWPTPCIDPVIYGRHNVRKKIARMADSDAKENSKDAKDINNLAHVYAQLALIFWEAPDASKWRQSADRFYTEGCRRYPASLALAFNRAHWAFFGSAESRHDGAQLFKNLLEQWDRYEFDPLGSDIGLAYTLTEAERVFPYYAYAQCVASYAVKQGGFSTSTDRDHEKRLADILRAAAWGYLGWEAIDRGNYKEGFSHLWKSLAIFEDNLPLLRSSLEWLLEYCSLIGECDADMASKVCDIFIACVNGYPAILLTHTHRVGRLFERADRIDDLQHVLEGWYRLGNITYSTEAHRRLEQEIDRFVRIQPFIKYMPARLLTNLRDASASAAGLTQFEWLIDEGAKLYKAKNGQILDRVVYYSGRVPRYFAYFARRAIGLLNLRRALIGRYRRFLVAGIQRFPWLDRYYEAYLRARSGDPISSMERPWRSQAALFKLTRMCQRRR